MKTALCYGDSLTWGFDPEGQGRHAHQDRWPSVLQAALGDQAVIVAEGLNGRTTVWDDHLAAADRNGARMLPSVLSSHSPLDLVIFMLGTNDLKPLTCGKAYGVRQGMQRLIEIVRYHAYPMAADAPDILLVSPPPIRETADPDYAAMFSGVIEESQLLAPLFADLADQLGCGFFDAASVATSSPVDGIHLDAANTRAIGKGLEPIARMMLGL